MKPTNLREAEHFRAVWHVDAERGVSPADLLKPSFWAHVARRLRPLAEIVVYAHDYSWRCHLLVRSATPLAARVVILNLIDLDKADQEANAAASGDTVEAVYRGPSSKWSVKRSDGAILIDKLDTKEAALEWIKSPPQQAQAA